MRTSGMRESILAIEKLSVGDGGAPIVRIVSMQAAKGEITVVIGPNGCGKSTLMKAICGVLRPSQGRVLFEGNDVTGEPTERLMRKGLCYVPQVGNIFPSLTVRENLEMGGYSLRTGLSEKIAQMCDIFPDLKSALRRKARTLSGGQQHMLAVARGLMVDPVVLWLDEPTAGLAPRAEDVIWERILAVVESGVGVVLVEQNVRRALSRAHWGYVLSAGGNVMDGPGHELLADPRITALYVGSAALS